MLLTRVKMLGVEYALTCLLLSSTAQAHGGMKFPVTRNLAHAHFCPHCANGKGVCGNGEGSQWTTSEVPALLHGDYETSRTVLYGGGTIEVEVWVTVGHHGIMAVELCDAPKETITSDCFKRLKRDPTDTRTFPYLPDHPEIVFLLSDDCMIRATLDSPARIRFLIPDNVNASSHAILRLLWNSGDTCSPHEAIMASSLDPKIKRYETLFNGAECHVAVSSLDSCGKNCPSEDCDGEKYINCADVAIVQSGETTHVTSSDYKLIPIEDASTTTTSTSPHSTKYDAKAITDFTTTEALQTGSVAKAAINSTVAMTSTSNTTENLTTSTSVDFVSKDLLAASEGIFQGCTHPSGKVDTCQAHVKGSQSWADTYCRDRCNVIGTGEDEIASKWCAVNNICTLIECTTSFHSNICTKV